MIVNDDEVLTRKAGAAITGAVNLTLNAVKMVKKGSNAGEVIEGTIDTYKFDVVGAIESIGPGAASQVDAAENDIVGVRRKKNVNLILVQDKVVADNQPLVLAAAGKVQPITLSTTPTAHELALIVAYAREAKTSTGADMAIEAELAL